MKKINDIFTIIGLVVLLMLVLFAAGASAQSTEFTYQGRLLDNTLPPTANYDFEFSLWDALANGTQQGTTQTVTGVAVANGIFTVRLNFGAQFDGAARFLQINVRPSLPPGGTFTTLAPRQPLTSAPYSIRSSNAASANSISCTLCITDGHIVSIDGAKVTGTVANATNAINATNATTATTAGNVTGVVAIANGGTGSSTQNFVDLTANQTVGGNKRFTGNIGIGTNDPISPLHLSGNNNNFAITFTNNANAVGRRGYRLAFDNNRLTFQKADDNGTFAENQVSIDHATGNVGIGTITPGAKLDVVGDVKFSGTITGNGAGLDNVNSAQRTTSSSLLGSLRWDLLKPTTFSVGSGPFVVAFDGANIWVANFGSSNVTKLRASDGADLGTFAVGNSPVGVAIDGANIWVANINSNNVTKLRSSDGANLGNFAVGDLPFGVVFDGANIWVTNQNGSNVTRLPAFLQP